MKSRPARPMLLAISVLLFAILSCSSPINFYAPAITTPTSTFTATSAHTPIPTQPPTITNTPTATPVPLPPVTITGCVFTQDCPEAIPVNSYLAADLETNAITQVVLPYTDKVLLNIGWCSLDEATLEENSQHISYIFKVDGISYLDRATVKQGYSTDINNPSVKYPCTFIGAMLGDWQIGKDHQVTIGYSFDTDVFDGWKTYPPFTNEYIFDLKPALLPTATPTATPTSSPIPTNTLQPQTPIPYNTPMPVCYASSSLIITNDTGGPVTLNLVGPTDYVFYLETGEITLLVCPGIYSYTGYGCGGTSISGTWDAPASHTFLCQVH